jgi:hypothetical protein
LKGSVVPVVPAGRHKNHTGNRLAPRRESEIDENNEQYGEHDLEFLVTRRRAGTSVPQCDGSKNVCEGFRYAVAAHVYRTTPAQDVGANAVVERSTSLAPPNKRLAAEGPLLSTTGDHIAAKQHGSIKKYQNCLAVWPSGLLLIF